jgi:hypothetical protein
MYFRRVIRGVIVTLWTQRRFGAAHTGIQKILLFCWLRGHFLESHRADCVYQVSTE